MKIAVFYNSSLTDSSVDMACHLRGVINELLLRGHMVNVFKRSGPLMNDDAIYIKEQLTKYLPFARYYPYPSNYNELGFMFNDVELALLVQPTAGLLELIHSVRGADKRKYLVYVDEEMEIDEVVSWTQKYKINLLLASSETVKSSLDMAGVKTKTILWPVSIDPKIYKPLDAPKVADILWIDSYQPDRKKVLTDYLINSMNELKLKACVCGENYPDDLVDYLNQSGVEVITSYSNLRISELFAKYRMAIHFPDKNNVHKTNYRLLQALASGIPVIAYNCIGYPSLLSPGKDFLLAKNPQEMKLHMAAIINTRIAEVLTSNGVRVVASNFTISKRVKELEAEEILPESKTKVTIAERKALTGTVLS